MMSKTVLCASALLCFGTVPNVSAAELNMRILGWFGSTPLIAEYEKPYWQSLEKRTGGSASADYRTLDELGLSGFDALRTLQGGSFHMINTMLAYIGGDDPLFMGPELPSLSYSFDDVRKLIDAYAPVIDGRLQSQYGGKLVAAFPYSPQILFCKGEIGSLDELQGKKVRVSGAFAAKAVEHFGAISVTLSAPEVYQALLQGVVDCAATGASYGNANDWHEVTDTLIPLAIGGSGIAIYAMSTQFWDSLTPAQQQAISTEVDAAEAGLWAKTEEYDVDGMNCNLGKDPCKFGRLGKMKLMEISSEDRERMKSALRESVLPDWMSECERVEPNCRSIWNDSVGKVVDIQM